MQMCVYGILHFKTPVLLFIHVSSYSPVPVVWLCWLEASHGGWEASVGAPPHRWVPAGHDRWHRSRRAHHRTTEPEGQGGSPHRNTLTGTCTQPEYSFPFTGKVGPTGKMSFPFKWLCKLSWKLLIKWEHKLRVVYLNPRRVPTAYTATFIQKITYKNNI